MTIATGVGKQVAYKAEVTWGTAPAAGGAQSLRRIMSTLSLRKQTYESQEIATHMQRVDMRHGVRSIGGAQRRARSAGPPQDVLAPPPPPALPTPPPRPPPSPTLPRSLPPH